MEARVGQSQFLRDGAQEAQVVIAQEVQVATDQEVREDMVSFRYVKYGSKIYIFQHYRRWIVVQRCQLIQLRWLGIRLVVNCISILN